MTTINASQLMFQMGQLKQQATTPFNTEMNPTASMGVNAQANSENSVNFSDLLGSAVNQVNSLQKEAGGLKKDFEMGKDGVDLVQVMVASEKSSLAFSALLETRNKLLKAYKEVLSTPV